MYNHRIYNDFWTFNTISKKKEYWYFQQNKTLINFLSIPHIKSLDIRSSFVYNTFVGFETTTKHLKTLWKLSSFTFPRKLLMQKKSFSMIWIACTLVKSWNAKMEWWNSPVSLGDLFSGWTRTMRTETGSH